MYTGLLHSHSYLRYFVLILLLVVIVKALNGMINKKPFGQWDNKFSLYLLIATHLQLLFGLVLYFVSPQVQFGPETMTTFRYWTIEHGLIMIIAIGLITAARVTSKKMTADIDKHKRLYVFNMIALILILLAIYMSGRKLVG